MSCVTASLCWTLMFVTIVSAETKTITAESGQDVTLPCRAANNNIIVVEWSRADLKDVFVYQDGHFIEHHQHPSFKNRVDLQDRQMKDGDVSLILKNVTIGDNGTYECRVFMGETRSWMNISIIYLYVVPPGQKITIRTGQENVILTCRAPTKNLSVVEWSRTDLDTEYVLLYQDGQFDKKNQHPSFKNRVDLQDRQMKDGDVSLIVNNLTTDDTGTYECRVKTEHNRRKRANLGGDPISSINLSVVDSPGPSGGSVGLIVALLVPVLLFVAVVGILIYRKLYQGSKKHSAVPQSECPLQAFSSHPS